MLRCRIIPVILLMFLVACQDRESGAGAVIERPDNPAVVMVGSKDREMNEAMDNAKATLDEFIAELKQGSKEGKTFSLKASFRDGDEVEHIWLDEPSYGDGSFRGSIGNEPLNIKTVKEGQVVMVGRKDVSDWMIIEKGRARGGFTVRVLRRRMNPKERQSFDESSGNIFADQ